MSAAVIVLRVEYFSTSQQAARDVYAGDAAPRPPDSFRENAKPRFRQKPTRQRS